MKSEQLDRKRIPYRQFDRRHLKTYVTIHLPFSERFAYWAGRNGKILQQKDRIDEAAAKAFAEGWERGANEK